MINKKYYILLVLTTLLSINSLAKKKKTTKVLISTEYGDIKIVLHNETPLHRDNFIKLVKEKYYDGTLFHRIIENFMIQGGDPESKDAKSGVILGNGGPGYTIPAEFDSNYVHIKGALAAARMGDHYNPKKESSGSQFYIVQGKKYTKNELDRLTRSRNKNITYTETQYEAYEKIGGTPQLDMDYTVFGNVIEGFDVIDKIASVTTGNRNRPKKDVPMTIKIVRR